MPPHRICDLSSHPAAGASYLPHSSADDIIAMAIIVEEDPEGKLNLATELLEDF